MALEKDLINFYTDIEMEKNVYKFMYRYINSTQCY